MAAVTSLTFFADEGGLAVVRIKPMGAGSGGVEKSSTGLTDGEGALTYATDPAR